METAVALRARLDRVLAAVRDIAGTIDALRDRCVLPPELAKERPLPGDTTHLDDHYRLYVDHLDVRLRLEMATHGDTYDRWYSDSRSAAQRSALVDREVLRPMTKALRRLDVPSDRSPRVVVVLGPAGVGKSKLVESGELMHHTGVDANHAALVDHDDVKRRMRKAGLAPNVEGLTPQETSPLLHRESMLITHRFARLAIERGVDLVCDLGCPATPEDIRTVVGSAVDAGYDVHVVEVRADLDHATSRAMHRHRAKMRPGEVKSGRFVHPGDIAAQAETRVVVAANGRHSLTVLETLASELAPTAASHVVFQRHGALVCLGSEVPADVLGSAVREAVAPPIVGEQFGL